MDYMRKKAVIFDLDGTLSDSIHSIKYSGDRTMEAFGYGPFSEEQYKYFVGDGAANLVKRALAAAGTRSLRILTRPMPCTGRYSGRTACTRCGHMRAFRSSWQP